ncbi:MAG: aminotransferase class V-fold PLP-dependent enzyme [Actinomycetota bacterium]|nr:aminotransferase class V-fold PLP-dependent enzyme [Actinomycetota bacterium]
MNDEDGLELDTEKMRRLGHETVDFLVDRIRPSAPSIRPVSREEAERRLGGPPPDLPEDLPKILEKLDADVLPLFARADHPGFFAFVPGQPTWPGALADFIASALNIHAIDWMEAPGPSQVELTVLDWLRTWMGLPEQAGGVLVSGGSAANMTALACARETLLGAMSDEAVVYVSDQAHSSMARAARILGFRPDQVRVLPVDDSFRMRVDLLAHLMESDARSGRRPLFVSASAGSTNTGAIDALPEIAEVCRERGAWFHIDGAYGAPAALTSRGAKSLRGLELADSITLDPHKWLYQPYECGCLLVRDGSTLHDAFEISPDYLKDTETALREPNFADLGIQLTRSFRALKLWMSIRYFGLDAFRAAIDRTLDLAELAVEQIEASDTLELTAPASLGVVCFRRRVEGADEPTLESVNAHLVTELAESGEGFISSTRLRARFSLRMCVLNHSTGAEDVDRVLTFLERSPVESHPNAAASPHVSPRQRAVTPGWLRGGEFTIAEVRGIPLFEGLTDEELERVRRVAYLRETPAGQDVLQQWESSRELYIVLDGTAAATSGDRHLRDLGPGDFFGEIAAMEWGASYTYPRLATVTAATPMRLLVLAEGVLPSLAREVPLVDRRIRLAISERISAL